MSDEAVRQAVAQMEAWLDDSAWEPDAQVLAAWEDEFQAAMAQAEKASGWEDLVARAHAAGRRLEDRAAALAEDCKRLKAELEAQGRGTRALKGYGASVR